MPEGKPHFRLERFVEEAAYRRPRSGGGARDYGRAYEQHAEALKQSVATAWADADSLLSQREETVGSPGAYLAFETAPAAPMPSLEWKREGLRVAAAKRDEADRVSGALFVPDTARDFLAAKLTSYGQHLENQARFAPIDRFAAARLETLWVDTRPVPQAEVATWWECWCWPDRVANLEVKANALHLSVSADRLAFPERVVVFVNGTKSSISRLVSSTDAVAELRLGRDTASFFTGESRKDQDGWVGALSALLADDRAAPAPAVCILDTGINRAHPLLETWLAEDDVHTVDAAWGTDDHEGHGTELAGLALLGDLTTALQSTEAISVSVTLESVKVLPPAGFPPNAPASFGLVTQQAVARPEIAKPDRERVFCLAISQEGVSGPRASSWSAAIDQAAFGSEAAEENQRQRRLMVVAAGNLPDGQTKGDLDDWDSNEVEDPGQAWNAITVGGVTQKANITESGHDGWTCAVEVDQLSPYSRVSAAWNRSVSPIKPELVMEAGNKGVDPADDSLWSGIDSLSLLTISHDFTNTPLSTTWATSAAAAQVAGMAARLYADDPDYWPETVRALLVHSARWTPPMIAEFGKTPQKGERLKLLRRYGYGQPNLGRARSSAAAALAMVSQQTLQPYKRENSSNRLNAMHLYRLPWPKKALAQLGDHQVRLRLTLSYFVDPNPSADAPLAPGRYRSFGLRFDLRKKGESLAAFQRRLNDAAELPEDDLDLAEADTARLLGPKAVSAGSLHCDEWLCNAADFIERDTIAVFPVGGWWKTSNQATAEQLARYSLVVTVDAGDADVDLYAEIEQEIAAKIASEAEVSVSG